MADPLPELRVGVRRASPGRPRRSGARPRGAANCGESTRVRISTRSGDFVKSPCDSMSTVTPAGFAYAAICWKPSTTRFMTSSLGSPSGILSPNIRTYFTPIAWARSMKRRPSSNCFSRVAGSFSCIREDAPRSLTTMPSAARSFFVSGEARPRELRHLREVHLAGDPAQLECRRSRGGRRSRGSSSSSRRGSRASRTRSGSASSGTAPGGSRGRRGRPRGWRGTSGARPWS